MNKYTAFAITLAIIGIIVYGLIPKKEKRIEAPKNYLTESFKEAPVNSVQVYPNSTGKD